MNRTDTLRTPSTQDYYLCYLLLEKNLQAFADHLRRFCPEPSTVLPRAYREAVLYINNVCRRQIHPLDYAVDVETAERFDRYCQLKAAVSDESERTNLTRREFGNTFWWYYEYQK